MAWTTRELEIIATTSRVGSAFSICGALLVIVTFCSSKSFHRPINRLAFFAAFGNIMSNVATVISRDGIHAGIGSDLCRTQAVFIQWFLPADALFCFAMATNVYLTVFKKYTTEKLKKLEWLYILLCYGVPMVPALVFLFIKDNEGIAMYGDATLWCWIAPEWQVVRVAAFYGPVWIVLVSTFVIYLLAGRVIFNLRQNLRLFAKSPPEPSQKYSSYHLDSFQQQQQQQQQKQQCGDDFAKGPSYSEVSSGHVPTKPNAALPAPSRPLDHGALQLQPSYMCRIEAGNRASRVEPIPGLAIRQSASETPRNAAVEANTAAWAYCRCAILFFMALIITWLPSSINRVYSLRHPEATPFGLDFAAALVLPCQGFWNALIYIITTFPACKRLARKIWRRRICWPFRRIRGIFVRSKYPGSVTGASDSLSLVE